MASGREFDRHSWCGTFGLKDPTRQTSDILLPASVLQLDPADRAVLRIADIRDAVQKKTFTKWVNKHLMRHWCYGKANLQVQDLFEELRDGWTLITLLEVLSHRTFVRARGRMRCHMIQNVQTVLDYLRQKRIKVVNIRADEIVDGNPKLTLGLIWTFILHFQYAGIIPVNCAVCNAWLQQQVLPILPCGRGIELPYIHLECPELLERRPSSAVNVKIVAAHCTHSLARGCVYYKS